MYHRTINFLISLLVRGPYWEVLILGLFCTVTTRGQYSSVWPSQSVNKTLVRFYAIISVFDDRYEKKQKQTNKPVLQLYAF